MRTVAEIRQLKKTYKMQTRQASVLARLQNHRERLNRWAAPACPRVPICILRCAKTERPSTREGDHRGGEVAPPIEVLVMTLDVLHDLVSAGESETLELKQSTGQRSDAARTACAMLNHRGGLVVVGARPDGTLVGQQVTDKTIDDLVRELSRIEPPAFPSVDRIAIGGGREVIVVGVERGRRRPYSIAGRAWRRVGSSTLEMDREQYNQMLLEELHGNTRWENEPVMDWSVDDLDSEEMIRTLEESIRRGRAEDPNTRDPKVILRGLGLVSRAGLLLRAAVVLFGRSDRMLPDFPQCRLRVARFVGRDRTRFLDNRQFVGNAFELLQRAERFLVENLPVAGRIVDRVFEREDDPLYPRQALREALANGFCHRDYSIGGGSVGVAIYDDRLEITSSGELHFGLTAEALYRDHESLPWNPLIAGVFYRRGIIEAWGRGTIKIAELMLNAGLPVPEIEVGGGAVTVRFRPSQYSAPQCVGHDLTQRQRSVLQALAGGQMSLAQIHSTVNSGIALRTLRDELYLLRRIGLIDMSGKGRGARWLLVRSE